MTTFAYTTGNPSNLTAGATASMNDVQGPLTDLRTFINGANITDTNVSAAGLGLAKLTPLILYGAVDGTTGAISVAGSGGWSSVRNAAGQYTLTFSPAFSATPTILVTPNTAGGATTGLINAKTASTAVVNTNQSTTGNAINSNFDFIAIGVR